MFSVCPKELKIVNYDSEDTQFYLSVSDGTHKYYRAVSSCCYIVVKEPKNVKGVLVVLVFLETGVLHHGRRSILN